MPIIENHGADNWYMPIIGHLRYYDARGGDWGLIFSSNSSLTMYADDILLSHPIHSSQCLQQVQWDIDLMSSCLSSKFLTIDAKNLWLLLTNSNHLCVYFLHSTSTTFLLNLLPPLNTYKGNFLHVIKFYWSPHIHAICSKARKVTGFIYLTFYKHSIFQTLVKLYVSLVLPYLTYCCLVWDPPPHTIPLMPFFKKSSIVYTLCVPRNGLQARMVCKLYLASFTFLQTYPSFQVCTQSHLSTSKFAFLAPTPTKDLRSYISSLKLNHWLPSHNSGSNSFSSSASKLWNSLPSHIG